MDTVAVFLAHGFEEIEAITQIDVLRRGEIDVIVVSITDNYNVQGKHKITVIADKLFSEVDFDKIDMLILPGGAIGVKNLFKHEGLNNLLVQFDKNKKPIAAICAAPMILNELGILNGKNAICYPACEDDLTNAVITNEPVVVDQHIITSKGIGTALDFSLEIVKHYKGKEKAFQMAKAMVMKVKE